MAFENKVYEGIHYSRFIASWGKAGLKMNHNFKHWLQGLIINDRPLPDDVIYEIYDMAMNGKLELEESAKRFAVAYKDQLKA